MNLLKCLRVAYLEWRLSVAESRLARIEWELRMLPWLRIPVPSLRYSKMVRDWRIGECVGETFKFDRYRTTEDVNESKD